MRWRDGRQSDNIEDRRGMSIPRGAKIGGVSGLGLLAVVLIGMFLGIDPTVLLQGGPEIQTPSVSVQRSGRPAVNDDLREFCRCGSGRYRRRLERGLPEDGADLSGADVGSFFRGC